MKRCIHFLFICAVVWISGAALRASDAVSPVRSIRLLPENRTLWGANASQHFLVLATFADGMERDVTSEAKFTLADPKVGKVDGKGVVTAVADGPTLLTASFDGRSAQTTIGVTGSHEKRPFSFAQDIGAILTKNGCNDSLCHGGVKGKNGFKLSQNALYPHDDYKWIVQGGQYHVLTTDEGIKVPRIDLKAPEKSLILLKPTMSIPHGGGLRFSKDSPDYQTLLKWVRSGAPYGQEGAATVEVERVEVLPHEVVLDPTGRQHLLVMAYLSNGRQQDLTDQVRYASNNVEVATVSPDGTVQAVRTGETSVMVRAAGHAASAVIGVTAKAIANYPQVPRNNYIDDYVFAKLRKFNIVPSEPASDSEFLRRVCLDLTGTLPPPNRVREFVASHDPQKRAKVVDALLNSPEYTDFWTFRFAELFRVAFFQNGYNPRWTEAYWHWIHSNVAQNTPYDQVARERLVAIGYSPESRHYLTLGEIGHPENHMAEELRVFFGRRLDCAQCHNHPFESWSQDQFWGMAAFFGHMDLVGGRGEEHGTVIYESPHGEDVVIGRSGTVVNPRTKQEVKPTFLDGTVLPDKDLPFLREKLADWMIAQPYFSEAAVNRLWGYFFGRGIVDPVDDFRSTNPPTHPELLKALAADFKVHKYDMKYLFRTIVNSRTYQLSSVPNDTNREDVINYSHALPRPLEAEVLFDGISQVTGIPDLFVQDRDWPGELPPGTRAINVTMPDVYRSRVLAVYGRSMRATLPELRMQVNLGEALHMLAGSTFTEKLSGPGGLVDRLLASGKSDPEIIEDLYLATLSRYPTAGQQAQLKDLIARSSSRSQAITDLLWSLVASREFSENH